MQTFADVLGRFRDHPEAKRADSHGKPAGERTEGLLGRRQVQPLAVQLIGKETNLLERQEAGLAIRDPQAAAHRMIVNDRCYFFFLSKRKKLLRSLV